MSSLLGFLNRVVLVAFAASIDGVDQSDLILNGGTSARDEFVYNIDRNIPESFGHRIIRLVSLCFDLHLPRDVYMAY